MRTDENRWQFERATAGRALGRCRAGDQIHPRIEDLIEAGASSRHPERDDTISFVPVRRLALWRTLSLPGDCSA